MRNLIFAINITLDGCCDHTKMIADEEIHEYFTHLMQDVDLLVFGRKTYELMVPFWPDVAKNQSGTKAMNEFARAFDSTNKVVFSQSLDSVEGNTRIVRTKLQDEILKLKQQKGKNILVGGVAVPSQLIELGLVDEYRFVVQPTLAGEGRRKIVGRRRPAGEITIQARGVRSLQIRMRRASLLEKVTATSGAVSYSQSEKASLILFIEFGFSLLNLALLGGYRS